MSRSLLTRTPKRSSGTSGNLEMTHFWMDFSNMFWRLVETLLCLNLALEALQILSLKDEQLERYRAEVICSCWTFFHRTTAWGFWIPGFFCEVYAKWESSFCYNRDFIWALDFPVVFGWISLSEVGGFAWAVELESSNGASGAVLPWGMDLLRLLTVRVWYRDHMLPTSSQASIKYFQRPDLWLKSAYTK